MDPQAPRLLVLTDAPTALVSGPCPHCGQGPTLDVFGLRHVIYGTNEGSVLVCRGCGGYAAHSRW